MNQSMYAYMKVGLVSFMAYPSLMKGEGEILRTIKKLAADEYFTAIEVTWIKDPAVRKQVAALLETSKMTVAYCANPKIGPTGLNINDTDEEGRQAAVSCSILQRTHTRSRS